MRSPKLETLYSTLLTNLGVQQDGIHLSPTPQEQAASQPATASQPAMIAGWDFEDGQAKPFNGEVVDQSSSGGTKCLKARASPSHVVLSRR